MFEQLIEVGEVVGKPIGGCPEVRTTEPSPVRSNYVPIVFECVDDELERQASIAPSVQKHKQWRISITPFVDVIRNTTYRQLGRTNGDTRLIR